MFNKSVRLRVQVTGNTLAIMAEPNKGESDEEDALQAIEHIALCLNDGARLSKVMTRNTHQGDRVDHIVLAPYPIGRGSRAG